MANMTAMMAMMMPAEELAGAGAWTTATVVGADAEDTETPRAADAIEGSEANSLIVADTLVATDGLVVVIVASTDTDAAVTVSSMSSAKTPSDVARLDLKPP